MYGSLGTGIFPAGSLFSMCRRTNCYCGRQGCILPDRPYRPDTDGFRSTLTALREPLPPLQSRTQSALCSPIDGGPKSVSDLRIPAAVLVTQYFKLMGDAIVTSQSVVTVIRLVESKQHAEELRQLVVDGALTDSHGNCFGLLLGRL